MIATRCFALLTAAALAASTSAQGEAAIGGWFAYGTGIGNGDFHVSAAGGHTEIVVPCGSAGFGNGSRFWVLARHNASTSQYDQSWISPVYDDNDAITRTAVADVDPAPGPEILIATRLGRVEVWNQQSRTLLSSLQTGLVGGVNSIAIADVDGDSDQDVVICEPSSVSAYDLDGTQLWTVAGAGGVDLAIGQMDADPALEVAVSDGSVIDCASQQVQWQWQNGFGIDVECADIDGDGLDELVFAEDWAWAWAFDIDTQLPKWSLPLSDLACLRIADIDSDPALEVLIGEGQWGDVLAYDSVTRQLEKTYTNPEHGVTSIAVGDVDGDGSQEVIWGAGFTSSGPDYWFVADAASQQLEWQSPEVAAGFVGPVRGDIDGDGNDEFICAAPGLGIGSSSPRVLIVDATTLELEYLSDPIPGLGFSSQVSDIAVADVDSDGDVEIFLADNRATALDWTGTDLSVVWQVGSTSWPTNSTYRQIAIADLDGDSTLEVVLGGNQFVHVYDYGATTETWNSFFLGGSVKDVVAADANLAGNLEILALSEDGNIYVFDGGTYTPIAILQDGGTDRTALHVLEGLPAMIVGDELGHMYLYLISGSTFSSIGPLPVAIAEIDGLGYYPALGFLHVSSGGRVALQFGLTPDWQTSDYGSSNTFARRFGTHVSLDLASARLASCGPFGLSVFDL